MYKNWLIAFLLFPVFVFTQQNQNTLIANQFFQNKEYQKAIPIYKDLLKQSYNKYLYQNMLTAYLKTKKYEEALKSIKKVAKQSNEIYIQEIDQGYIHHLLGNSKKRDQHFNFVLKYLSPKAYIINSICQRFENYKFNHQAISCYQKGRQILSDKSLYNIDISRNYLALNEQKKGYTYLIKHLRYYPNDIEEIEGTFNKVCTLESDQLILKEILFKSVQKDPENGLLVQLLIWNLNTLKDFSEAILQAKAHDKKTQSGGKIVLELSKYYRSIKAYKQALFCLEYTRDNGNDFFAFLARKEILTVKKEAIENSFLISKDSIEDLVNDYRIFIDNNGINIKTISIAKDLAYMQGFYLQEYEKAITTIKMILEQSNMDRKTRGQIKLLLADIQLLSGDKWEAQLTYWQIDKSYKESTIGHQAKYKVAMLSYYTGDFKWAQNQLEVLKGSTSKLISNDAIALSTFITENYGIDSNEVPLKLFAQAQLLIYQKQYQNAILKLDTIKNFYSDHILIDDILMAKAAISKAKNKVDEAKSYYLEIIERYNKDLLIDDALFELAELLYEEKSTQADAMKYYESILLNHPESIYVIEARKKYRKLRGDNLN